MSVLTASNVVVRYGAAEVLAGVDLRVDRGELVALVGPNGAGKSTLLAMLSGDQEPTSGTVEILGRPVAEWRLRALARERAMLTQEQRIAFPFSAREVVTMGRAPWRGRPEEDLDELEVAAAMHTAEVTHLADRAFGSMSGGEKGRTSYARVLAQQTGVLLLDEPTASLDLRHQETLLDSVRSRVREGAAAVAVLHDLNLAAAWSDRIVLLHQGRVVSDGPPSAVLRPELLSEVYDHPISVITRPGADGQGDLLVLPDRHAQRSLL
ncbi:heme ABC transporter ATP-binding protein [Nocardioides speluncae]|uniref:heme ABC transporter ATP-binding protein n=1 Tax=Nocardioides speluncae TaxID=2670337 RepID=UPI000D6922EB|nr:heme ABC transporter ATP-binding protein [Nocardioides speluncae]